MGPSLTRKCFHNGFWIASDDGKVGAGRAIGTAATLLPILQGAWIESKSTGKLRTAEAGGRADGTDIDIEWKREVVDGRGRRVAFGNLDSLAHGLKNFFRHVNTFHGLLLLAVAPALMLAASAANVCLCSGVGFDCSFFA